MYRQWLWGASRQVYPSVRISPETWRTGLYPMSGASSLSWFFYKMLFCVLPHQKCTNGFHYSLWWTFFPLYQVSKKIAGPTVKSFGQFPWVATIDQRRDYLSNPRSSTGILVKLRTNASALPWLWLAMPFAILMQTLHGRSQKEPLFDVKVTMTTTSAIKNSLPWWAGCMFTNWFWLS